MLDSNTAATAADVARTLTENLPFSLSGSALRLYRVLIEAAVTVAERGGYSSAVTEVVIFAPAEAVALDAGVHPSTVYRALAELRAEGVVDARGHYCTHRGQTKQDGTLWAVRLTPRRGCRARVGYTDMKGSYRDLGGDIERGRTAWALMRESKNLPRGRAPSARHTLRWALSPTDKAPVTVDSRKGGRRDLEAVLDVRFAAREDRPAAVDLAAQALAAALSDRGSANFYRRLCWQLLRRADAGGGDHWHAVYEQARRALTDSAEGFARAPGALFVSRVKRAPWWAEVWAAPPSRVGPRAISA